MERGTHYELTQSRLIDWGMTKGHLPAGAVATDTPTHRAHVAQQGSWRVMLPPCCGCGLKYGAQKRMLVPGRAVRWARQQPLRAHSVGILWKCAKISLNVFSAIEASLPFTKAAAAPRARSRYL